jgi:membrane protease subunit HflK
MVWKEPGKDKDPWDGERRSPELEQWLRRLQQRWSSLFGRRRRREQPTVVLWWLIPVVLAAWLLSGCYVVDEGDRGVELLFGRYRDTVTPGLHWNAPWPIGASEIVSGVEQGAAYVRGYGALVTADGAAISVEVAVHYRIVDLPQFLYGNANPNDGPGAAAILGTLTDAAVSAAVAHAGFNSLSTTAADAVADDARGQLTESLLNYRTGLEVTKLELRKFAVPAAVASAHTLVHQAEADAARQADEARLYADDLLPRARGEADSRLAAAKAYAAKVVQDADGDVTAFQQVLPAYRRAQAVTRDTLYLDTYEDILNHVDKVVVLGRKGQVTLSLDKPFAPDKPAAAAKPKHGSGGG